jgi:rhodanese-related sulfurtransferase
VARQLRSLGIAAAVLEGGFDAWKARHPVEPATPSARDVTG